MCFLGQNIIFGPITTSHSYSPIHLAASFCLFPTPAAPHIVLPFPGSYDGWLLRITVTLHSSLCCCLGSVLHTPAPAILLAHSGPGNRREDCELQCQLAGAGICTSSLHWTFNYLHFSVSTLISSPHPGWTITATLFPWCTGDAISSFLKNINAAKKARKHRYTLQRGYHMRHKKWTYI